MSATNASLRQKVCLHVLDTLPDSVSERRDLLLGVIEILPNADPVRSKAILMSKLMDEFERHQQSLPLRGANGEAR